MTNSATKSGSSNRHGFTLIELLWFVGFLAVSFWLLSRPPHRAVEIVRTVTGDVRYDTIVAVVAFFLTLLSWICIIIGISRLRIRYGDLLYFPLIVGLPLGFAVVPFRPFSLPVYGVLLSTAMIAILLALFCLQSVFVLWYRMTPARKRYPIPDELPPFSPGYVRHRTKPENIKEGIPHPNRSLAWEKYYNSIGIHQGYANDAYFLDDNVEEFRNQYSIYCRKLLLHSKQPDGYLPFWSRGTGYLETIIESFVALDFDGAKDWANYVRAALPENSHILSQHDERLIRAVCAVILKEDGELERLNLELAKPVGWLDRMVTREPKYWKTLIAGIVEHDARKCQEAIRIQAEMWYLPTLSDYFRLNENGVAMTNLCRWCGIPVPAFDPIIPEKLLWNEYTS